MANPHIYITEKQIKKRHLNKETGKYEGYNHSWIIDNNTGEPLQMCHVLLPSAEHRELQFEPDSNGIDRNKREAYIQVPVDAIKDTKEKRRKVLYLSCKTSTFTVYFQSERIRNVALTEGGKVLFDSPEKVKLDISQMQKIWPTSLQTKVKKVEKTKDKEATQKQQKQQNQNKKRDNTAKILAVLNHAKVDATKRER